MTDKNTDTKKAVKNQLFNAAVTGGTFEDFSQNAVLFPAQDVPTFPAIINTPNVVASTTSTLADLESFTTFQPDEIFVKEHQQQQETHSQYTSVLSSFSSVLTFSGGTQQDYNIPLVPSIAPVVPLENTPSGSTIAPGRIEPIPLFQTTIPNTNESLSTPFLSGPSQLNFNTNTPPQGSTNNNLYRRSGLKKPTYAQVPGLLSSRPTNEPSLVTTLDKPISPALTNSSAPQLLFSQPKNLPQTPGNYFQPIHTEGFSPNTSLRTTPQSDTSSSILQPVDPLTLTTVTNTISFGNSNSATPTSLNTTPVPSSIFSQSSPFLNPSTVLSSTSLPGFNSTLPFANSEELHNMPSSNVNAGFTSNIYRPVYHHWFSKKIVEGRTLWLPFSMVDSLALEAAFTSADLSATTVVATDGGRYDVNILRRERYPVYWTSAATEVRRCSWFHKGNTEGRFLPYEENIATMLEAEFRIAFETNEWHRKVELSNGDTVVFHGPDVLVLFPPVQSPDAWGNAPQTQPRPKVVKRGMDEFDIDEGETVTVDHLLFIVHGIGAVCDLKFRSVEEVVDEFRSIALRLVRSHYRSSYDNQVVHRIEVLPISWHARLHSEDTGIDQKLKNITLQSIPRLRDFANGTLLDILFYTSPMYCQTIITTVGSELNRIFEMFKQRNPGFSGRVSLGGHSLGSLILFDILSHQRQPEVQNEEEIMGGDDDLVMPLKKPHPKDRRLKRRISYMMSAAGTGQPQLQYPHLNFQPIAFFAIGSPIGMFVTIRGLDMLGKEYSLPTCPSFLNIFHPYDPVAYRVESLVNPELANLEPVLIPHHKGRKRMHLELKETMARVSADLKQKVIDSMKNTFNAFYQMAVFGKSENPPNLEAEVDKAYEERLAAEQEREESINAASTADQQTDLCLGMLNKGRRIDYVLQEAPLESFNEYLFALSSHVVYWESEDTMLLILKEIYNAIGIVADNHVTQQSTTIDKSNFSASDFGINDNTSTSAASSRMGVDPTIPISLNTTIGPPPTTGFVKKS